MLEGGPDIRYVQQMLGHADLSSTQIYTRVSLRKLEAVHAASHPGATTGHAARGEARGTRSRMQEKRPPRRLRPHRYRAQRKMTSPRE